MKFYKSDLYVHEIFNDSKLINKCMETYDMIQKTKPERTTKGIDTWFKYEDGKINNLNLDAVKSVTICGRVKITGDLLHIFSVLSETDLLTQFIKQFEEISKLDEVSPFRWIIQTKVKMPITFTNRDLIAVGTGILNREEKNILLCFQSRDTFIDRELPKETSKYKRIECLFGFYHIQYIEDNHYYVTYGANIDPKIPIIPWFILNQCIKESCYYIMDGLRTQIANQKAAEVYAKRREEKAEFYNLLKEKLLI
jgi:hypothetical protein